MPEILAVIDKRLPKQWRQWSILGLHKRKPFKHIWRFRNLILAALSIYVALMVTEMAWFQSFMNLIKSLKLFGVFLGGMFFASSFTVTTGIIILVALSPSYPLWALATVAGLGASFSDLTIFELVRSGISNEIKDLFAIFDKKLKISRHFDKKLVRRAIPLLGAAIIASPLPDELGVGLMGLSTIPTYLFVILSMVLNTIGIFTLIAMIR